MMTRDQREAMRIRLDELESINGGRLTPSMVVADAKDHDSPLHGYFQWDIGKAAEAYWIEQARELITSVRVVVKTERRSINTVYYVRDPAAAADEQGYTSVVRLRSDADLAREALVAEFTRIAALLRRARDLAEVLELAGDVDTLLTAVVGLRQRFEQPPPPQTM